MNQGFTTSSSTPRSARICWVREDTARKINATLDRLALVIDVLQETAGGDAIPGTRGLREGAEASLEEILHHLSRLPRQAGADPESLPGPEEEHAMTWLVGKTPHRWLPPGTIVRITEIIRRLLPERPIRDGKPNTPDRSYPNTD